MYEKILIANRGAIAVRIERTLKKMGIKSVAVYSKADQDSLHVQMADISICLGEGSVKETYLDYEKIISIAIENGVEAIHPGYGFLSENTVFAELCSQKGITFIGPTPSQIKQFGLKHLARELALKANIPLLEGTGILSDVQEALSKAEQIGYPVILKSTAGGGGIGMRICNTSQELENAFENVSHLAKTNFNDSSLFLEQYIKRSRHIEVQIFGANGDAIALGERDCSVQRRNQKVVEETPAPSITQKTREDMYRCAQELAKSSGYKNAGTVEFLYDDLKEKFYFLEVNTRLQVEHGVTEEIYDIDLVEMMVLESAGEIKDLSEWKKEPKGHSIQVRVYAEDCLNGFTPSIGKIDEVNFNSLARVETWIQKGTVVSSLYDPMLAKLIVHGEDRDDAIQKMQTVLQKSKVYGITTNMEYLNALFEKNEYKKGELYTAILNGFQPEENTLEVLDGGLQTTVQDYPGMKGYWFIGVPPCGPMDDYNFRLGNRILCNPEGAPGLELTLRGGSYKFRTTMSFCLTGANMNATLDDVPVQMYQVVHASASQVLKLKECSVGMRCYLLVAGGFDLPKTMGSCSTFIDGKFGGHNGRSLKTGDILHVNRNCVVNSIESVAEKYHPKLSNNWVIGVIPGPQPTAEYLDCEYLNTLTNTEYEVNFNSARTGIRLNGPIPQWVRKDGGEAGLHPSNIHDNPYAIGTLDLTGDQSILLGPDGPSLGGFICPVTTAKSQLWKLGQLHPGDKVRFQLLDLEQAESLRIAQNKNINKEHVEYNLPTPKKLTPDYAILARDNVFDTQILIRLAGEENILVEYGEMKLDIDLRFRVHVLMEKLKDLPIIDLTPGIRSLQIHFDLDKITVKDLVEKVLKTNRTLEDLKDITVNSRIIKLPLSWDDPQTQLAAKRYQETVRENAPWCPSNPEFIRRINGLDSIDEVKNIVFDANYLVLGLGDVYLGAPVATPLDPRHRMVTTKYNPARPWTPENAVGIGGAYLCIYGMEGPGGYQFVGRTIQMWNSLKETKYFKNPWLLSFFDQIKFYPVTSDEILKYREDFIRGNFDIEIEETQFHLGEYHKFLEDNKLEISKFKEKQETAFEKEREMWKEKGLDEFTSQQEEKMSISEIVVPDGCEGSYANIPGSIWKILVKEGQAVNEGDTIIILESMKMEFHIVANSAGVIDKLYHKAGEQVNAGELLACISI